MAVQQRNVAASATQVCAAADDNKVLRLVSPVQTPPSPLASNGPPPTTRLQRCGRRAWACATPLLLLLTLVATLAHPRAWEAQRLHLAAQRLGPQAMAGALALQRALAAVSGGDDAAKLRAVNAFFNQRIQFSDDTEVWGRADYWASPLELLDKGRGDCEDFATAKYFSLLLTGLPPARLRLVYVRLKAGTASRAHMVLAYTPEPGAEPLILDNLVAGVLPASQRPELVAEFSFNRDGLWRGLGEQAAADPLLRLAPWRELIAKARVEGFL